MERWVEKINPSDLDLQTYSRLWRSEANNDNEMNSDAEDKEVELQQIKEHT